MIIARCLALAAGALILAAVAHVTVIYTDGYGTPHAWVTLAVAFGVACGSVFCGMAWTSGAGILRTVGGAAGSARLLLVQHQRKQLIANAAAVKQQVEQLQRERAKRGRFLSRMAKSG